QVGRALPYPRTDKKYFFPCFRHAKHLVRSISMVKKGLKKQRNIPMKNNK
ncbi:MAG: hypothetical protein ACJAVF_003277, partial [Paraglaciecola sp.]